MGISGLMTWCLEHQRECCEFVNLIEVARQRRGIEILVDYYGFQHFIVDKIWTSLGRLRNNLYLRILGGEYKSMAVYLKKLIKDLQSLDIRLVFFMDGTKGCSKETMDNKLQTWTKRHQDDIKHIREILAVCYEHNSIEQLSSSAKIRPVLLEVVFKSVLKECGCRVFTVTTGEADCEIAKELLEREKAFAILGNDSDFCIFKDCRFIPFTLFDIRNDLQLDACEELPDKPLRLEVGVISSKRVAHSLKFSDPDMLIELSIVAGNDFTSHYMKGNFNFLYSLDIDGQKNRLENIVSWLQHYKKIENHPFLSDKMKENSKFASAVQHSRNFYNLSIDPNFAFSAQPTTNRGFLKKLIQERIDSGNLISHILAMHNRIYWHRMLLEDINNCKPGCEHALANLRSYIYRMLLPLDENTVIEYGQGWNNEIMPATVRVTHWKWIPQLDQIDSQKIFVNLRTFHKIMVQLEPGLRTGNWPHDWIKRYGRRNGFLFYCLRYFLLLNWQRNLAISEDEFLALFALMFGVKNESEYQEVAMPPTSRSITIYNWMQNIYRYAYSFLGSLLYLQHEFPKPEEIFSGSIWNVYHRSCNINYYPPASKPNLRKAVDKARSEMDSVIHERRHMIRYLVDGIFFFQD